MRTVWRRSEDRALDSAPVCALYARACLRLQQKGFSQRSRIALFGKFGKLQIRNARWRVTSFFNSFDTNGDYGRLLKFRIDSQLCWSRVYLLPRLSVIFCFVILLFYVKIVRL